MSVFRAAAAAFIIVSGFLVLRAPRAARAAETLKVEAAESGCPRRRDVVAALEARLPGLSHWTISSVTILRLQLTPTESLETVLLRLWDDRGNLALERRLSLDPQSSRRPRDQQSCQALAEATALVTVRYLREIGYRPPAASVPDPNPPPPEVAPPPSPSPSPSPSPTETPPIAAAPPEPAPPPAPTPPAVAPPTTTIAASFPPPSPPSTSGYLSAGPAVRLAPSTSPRNELNVTVALHTRRLAASLAAGVSSESVVAITGGAPAELRLRAFPFRLGLAVPLALPTGILLPTIGFSGDLLSFRAVGLADARSGLRFDPAAEAGLGYLLEGSRFFVRLSALGGLTLAPRDFQTGEADAYRTPAGYFRGQLELGLRLWKNSRPALL